MSHMVLVTGVAGFIGSHVADHCLSQGMCVVGLDDLSGGFVDNIPAGATFVRGSVTDAALVERLFQEHAFDYVYHLAAYAAEGLSHFIRRYNYQTNLLASVNLVNEAVKHDVRCFVFTSSIAVYGAGQTPMTENLTPKPEDPYGISKYAFELDLEAANTMFGLPFVVFRPHNVYGERQNIADRYRNVIGIFMNQVMQGRPMTVFGDGSQSRAFSHIDDVAPLIARAPLVSAAYNNVFNAIADAFGVPCRINHLPARNEVLHAFSSHEKVQRVFGMHPQVELREGLDRMAAWARVRGPMPQVVFNDIEVRKHLPPSWANSEQDDVER